MTNNSKRRQSSGRSPMDEALKYLTPKARTIREVERHLDERQYGEYEIQQVIDRLIELDYLNDVTYCQEFIRTRLATKPVSRKKLYEQLSAHEVPKNIIEDALNSLAPEQEQENAHAVAEKFYMQFQRAQIAPEEMENRLMKRLLSRGYSYDAAKEAIRSLSVHEYNC